MAKTPRLRDSTIIEALQKTGGIIGTTAQKLGLSRRTMYRRIQQNPKLQEALNDARERVTDMAEGQVYSAVADGQAWAVCFYLKCQAKQRGWSERQELSGPNGGPIPLSVSVSFDPLTMTDEELRAIIAQCDNHPAGDAD